MTMLSRVTENIAAADSFTDWIYVQSNELCTLTVTGTWAGTLTMQCKLFTGTTPIDIDTKTENGRWDIPGGGDWWRVGFKAGEYTSGAASFTIQG